jgi:peptide/nickel transport system substrate-binding protein
MRIPTEKNGWQGMNRAGYVNAEMDALLAQLPRTLQPAQQREMFRRLNEIFSADLPLLPIYTRPVISVTRKGFQGWLPTGTTTSVSWNIESWDLPR